MKTLKIFLTLFILSVSSASFGQYLTLGGGLAWGSQIENAGINLRGFYNMSEQFRFGSNFTFFLSNTSPYINGEVTTRIWEFNVDAHYIYPVSDRVSLYPFGGVNITGVSWNHYYYQTYYPVFQKPYTQRVENNGNSTEPGLNLGAGFQFNLGSAAPYLEFKYVISDYDQAVIGFGIHFMLQ
jgi:outer membrane protein X